MFQVKKFLCGNLSAMDLPPALLDFIRRENIDLRNYDKSIVIPRYIRTCQRRPPTLERLQRELGTLRGFSDFPRVYALDSSVKLANTNVYTYNAQGNACRWKQAQIYGMDMSSALVVVNLDIQPNNHVLDVCCAPGAKLCMASEYVGDKGTLTGVDVSAHRLATCRSMVKRYSIPNVRLFCQDATTFDVHAPSTLFGQPLCHVNSTHSTTHKPFHAPRSLRHDPQWIDTALLYDRVMVDAECTHDGSLVHLWKQEAHGWDTLDKTLDPERLNTVTQLQRRLLAQGWAMLKPGGILIYSTCSLTRSQNEDVIAWFMHAYQGQYSIQDIWVPSDIPRVPPLANEGVEGWSKLTRLEPFVSRTGGMFLCKLYKL
jgi:16S rRNA C967 or C1407 C5-methylase (RsmB/RsmF family)